jgi:aldehyde:ferredoxin oxidoreductase
MMRAFNMKAGWTRADDTLPERMSEPHVSGSVNEVPVEEEELQTAVTQFYSMMGWDAETGEPTETKLQELEIAWVADA